MDVVGERRRFREVVAPQLARQLGDRLEPFRVSPLSTRFVFLADRHRLVVLCGDQEEQHHVDLALAFGLAWAGDRDLFLALPDEEFRRAS